MEPSYLEAKTDTAESMRRLLFAGLIAVADAHGGISSEELDIFAKFFGKYAFSEKLNIERVKETIGRRASELVEKASETQRMQVLRDVCLMAKADGGVKPSEKQVLDEVASHLLVPVAFIDQTLDAADELD